MPIYEFYCSTCDDRFEALLPRGTPRDSAPCPICGTISSRIHRAPAVRAQLANGGCEVFTAFPGGCCGGQYGCGARSSGSRPAVSALP